MIKPLVAFLVSFVLSVVFMPLIIKFFKRKSASQTILGYVEEHKEKNGTLTMGGVVFILVTLSLVFFFLKSYYFTKSITSTQKDRAGIVS